MLVPTAEDSYRQGVRALTERRFLEAQALFEAAVAISRKSQHAEVQPRYLSFYGYCLGVHSNRHHEGVDLCRQATQKESYNADLQFNLAMTLLTAGRRREAHDALLRGFHLQPGHRKITKALRDMGIRRRPPIPFLGRGNPVNIVLGRLVYGLRGR
jgi:hypothetical protein